MSIQTKEDIQNLLDFVENNNDWYNPEFNEGVNKIRTAIGLLYAYVCEIERDLENPHPPLTFNEFMEMVMRDEYHLPSILDGTDK